MTLTQNVIGRWAVVLHQGQLHVGTVMDMIHGSDTPKRIRVQRGKMLGNVLQPHEYTFKNWLTDEEIDP